MASSTPFRDQRRRLASDLAAIAGPTDLLAFQLALIEGITKCEQVLAQSPNDEIADHLFLLRLFGDALAWRYLHSHTIRQLAKGQGRPPNLTGQGKAFELTVEVATRLCGKGLPALVADLTSCLRISDVIVAEDPEAPGLIECKSSGPTEPEKLRGRSRRQYSRMKGTLDYLRHGRAKLFGEDHERLMLETSVVPTYNWEVVESVCSEALASGLGSRLISRDELVFAVHVDNSVKVPREIDSGEFDANQAIVAFHGDALNEPWPTVPPPLAWPVGLEVQLALLERDIALVHMFRPTVLIGYSNDKARICGVDRISGPEDHAYAVELRNETFLLSSNFTQQVLYGYRQVENIAEEMLDFAIKSADAIEKLADG